MTVHYAQDDVRAAYYTYITASKSKVLYTGVTSDLEARMVQHKRGDRPGFTKRYNVNRLVYFEEFSDVRDAIDREKEIKGWVRRKKVELIESANPDWMDLSEEW